MSDAAEGFGADAQRYDRARPRYPDALIQRIVRGLAGRRVLDVGTGTGIAARQLLAAGCQVLGVDADPRMAEFARGTGVDVEVATFDAWDPAGRTFDAVVSGQSWHWLDPVAGAAKAAEVLRPHGRLAVFWNTGRPPRELEEAFAEVYRRVLPQSLAERLTPDAVEAGYAVLCARTMDGIRATGAFGDPEQWQFEWTQSYTRDEWLDALPTSGGVIPPATLAELLRGVSEAVDAFGGAFLMSYLTIVVTAVRSPS